MRMTRRATATTTMPKTARKKYALRSGFPRRLSALALMTAHTSGHPTAARRSIPPPEKGRQPGCYARRDDAEDPCTRSVHRPRRRCLAALRGTDLVDARASSAANGRARRHLSRGGPRPRGPGPRDVERRCALREATDNGRRRGGPRPRKVRQSAAPRLAYGDRGTSANSSVSAEPEVQRLAGRPLNS